jgi:tetratricopeptide (TPR) repeat protein/tRNA A-37 threonylcarbamoyl transferase component Bud32
MRYYRRSTYIEEGRVTRRDLAVRVRPVNLISEGRRGQVFVGYDELLRRRVIVKTIASDSFESDESRWQLIAEAQLLAQLDHPNIVRIHDYSEHDGHDIFTIEYVEGAKLSKTIATTSFGDKVRVAIAVANALAVTHRNGILHGPFSLAGIVVAKKSEIKVIDYCATSTSLDAPCAGNDEWTMASDMESFGVLLRAMFGETDHDVRVLIAMLTREAASERPTIATVIARLEALARRPARRIRVAAAVIFAALCLFGATRYTIDLRDARGAAMKARVEAEARRAKANELVAMMIEDLHPRLESVGRLEILDAIDAKAIDYFASLRPDEISPAELAVSVHAQAQLGITQLTRVNLPASLKTLRRAVSAIDTARLRHPGDEALLFAANDAHSSLLRALFYGGDTAGAMQQARLCVQSSAELVHRKPKDVRYLQTNAETHGILASMLDRTEDIAGSLRESELSLELKRRVLRLNDSDDVRLSIAISLRKQGMALFKLGRFDDAERIFAELRQLLDDVGSRRPGNKIVLDKLETWARDLATVKLARGDGEAASRISTAFLATGDQLTMHDPDNLEWRQHLGVGHRLAGDAARMNGNIPEAMRHHERAVDILSAMFGKGQRTLNVDVELAQSRIELARTLLAANRVMAAAGQTDLVVQEFQTRRQELPAQKILADALLVQGETRAARGDFAGATVAWEDALSVLEPLRVSPDPRIAGINALVLLRLGREESARPLIDRLASIGYHINGREKGPEVHR